MERVHLLRHLQQGWTLHGCMQKVQHSVGSDIYFPRCILDSEHLYQLELQNICVKNLRRQNIILYISNAMETGDTRRALARYYQR
jgi:hypothetical protein